MKWPQPEPRRGEARQTSFSLLRSSETTRRHKFRLSPRLPTLCSCKAATRCSAGDSMFWVHLIIFTAGVVRGCSAAGGCSLCSALEHVNNHYTCLNNSECSRAVQQPAAAAARRGMEIWTTPASSRHRHRQPPSRSYADNCQAKMLCC